MVSRSNSQEEKSMAYLYRECMMNPIKSRKNFLLTAKMIKDLYLISTNQLNSGIYLWRLDEDTSSYVILHLNPILISYYVTDGNYYNLKQFYEFYEFNFFLDEMMYLVRINKEIGDTIVRYPFYQTSINWPIPTPIRS